MRLALIPAVVLSLLLGAGCAGFRPVAPERQTVFAGEPSAIALPNAPDGGADLTWFPGDGCGPEEGGVFRHVFQRPGIYRVRVEASGGSDEFEVEVEPRPVLRAIPSRYLSMVMAAPAFWSRVDQISAFAERLAGRDEVAAVLEQIRAVLGAEPSVPAQLVELGIDPAEGIGLVSFVFDPDSTWLLVGILDEERAVATVRRLGELEVLESLEAEAGRFFVGADGRGGTHVFGVLDGYLALYTGRDPASAPLEESIELLASAREASLAASPSFQAARRLAPGDDLIVFHEQFGGPDLGRTVHVGVELGEDAVVANYHVALPEAEAPPHTVPASPAPEVFRYPTGAVAFLALSFDPAQVVSAWEQFLDERRPGQRGGSEAEVRALLQSLSGNMSAGVYFDEDSFTRLVATLVGGDFGDRTALPPLFARVELGGAEAVERVRTLLASASTPTGDGWRQEGPFFFRQVGTILEIATLRARHLRPRPEGTTDYSRLLPLQAGVQALYVDVAGIVDSILRTEPRSMEEAMMRALFVEKLGFLRELKSVSIDGRLREGGVAGQIRVELRSE